MSGFVGIAGILSILENNTASAINKDDLQDKAEDNEKRGATVCATVLERMLDRIAHRGPHGAGTFIDNQVALGFRHLSLYDLPEAGESSQPISSQPSSPQNPGSQPLSPQNPGSQSLGSQPSSPLPLSNTMEGDTIIVVLDGEIYNASDLRTQLEAQGHRFATSDAAEVLIHGYQEWQGELPNHLRGMFAFVLYDREQGVLFGARCFFGIKPLYYTRTDTGSLLFGSEIKSFLEHPGFKKELNRQALKPYLTFQYSVLDETFFKGVFKLPPAHRFTYQLKTCEMSIERYWDADFSQSLEPSPKASRTFEECTDQLAQVIDDSINAHRITGVRVGSFLSGGIDSSYMASAVRPPKTFSIGFENEGFNETTQARELSDILGIENHRLLLDPSDGFEAFSTIQYHMDEPHSDPSIVPLYFLAKMASEHVRVVFSGEGGDELFGGYELYDEPGPTRAWKRRVPSPVRRMLSTAVGPLPRFKGRAFLRRGSGRPEDYFIGQVFIFDEDEASALLKPEYRKAPSLKAITAPIYERVAQLDELSKKQYLDLNLWLPGDCLLKGDKMAAAHSLEARMPLLDKLVMEEAQTTPAAYRISTENTKCVLRAAAARTIPAEWANRVKIGFLTPVRIWLKEDRYYEQIRTLFASELAGLFFDREKLLALLDAHRAGKTNNGRKIWTVYSFLVWYQRFFIDEAV